MPDYPTRLWHRSAVRDAQHNMVVDLAWDAPSFASPCVIREVVRYLQQDPVFVWNPPNPTINRPYVEAWRGHAPDTHHMPVVRVPRVAGRWVAVQEYEWSLDQVTWTAFGQPYRIEREIRREGAEWTYRITKRCWFSEGNGRQFFQMFSAVLPG